MHSAAMWHNSQYVYMPNRHCQRSALRTFFPSSSFSPPDSKEFMRRGVLFSSVAIVLLLVGAILTWLGFNDMFGGKVSMTGPLLIGLSLLLLLMSCKQFMQARKRNHLRTTSTVQMETRNARGVTAVVVDHDDGNGAATIVTETWDNVGADTDVLRVTEDLAPPPYTDIAQLSCSSNCPSFISVDDRNEAPPTYEETCGEIMTFDSDDTSLANSTSRRCSSQLDTSPSPRHSGQQGRRFFPNDLIVTAAGQPNRSANTLSPNSALSVPHTERRSSSFSKGEQLQLQQGLIPGGVSSPVASSSQDEGVSVTGNPTNSIPASHPVSESESGKRGGEEELPCQWSRRSFSSILSYTCLLSESGEVSSQVFNTSSMIQEMLPPPPVATDGKQESSNLLGGSGLIPTRSRSMSCVNVPCKGVPYDLHQHLHSVHSVPMHSVTEGTNTLNTQSLSSISASNSLSHNHHSSQISKSPSFCHANTRSPLGCDATLLDLLRNSQLPSTALSAPPRVLRTKEQNSSSQHVQEVESAVGRLPLMAHSQGQGSQLECECNSQERNFPKTAATVKLVNTQDIQETI